MHGGIFGTRKTRKIASLRRANEVCGLIVTCGLLLLVAGCDSLGIRDYLADDQVPQTVKDQPRLVQSAPPPTEASKQIWPRLGDVPSMPKDFSPAPVYTHYMDELAYDRGEAQAEKQEVEGPDGANGAPATAPAPYPVLRPPHLPGSAAPEPLPVPPVD